MREILSSPLFGITLSIVAFKVGLSINEKVKHPLANPLIIALIIIVATLKLFGIPMNTLRRAPPSSSLPRPGDRRPRLTVYRQRAVCSPPSSRSSSAHWRVRLPP